MTALLLLLMCRPLLTLCRRHRLGELLPIDDHVYYHKLSGVLLMFFSALHTAMHLVNLGGGASTSISCIEFSHFKTGLKISQKSSDSDPDNCVILIAIPIIDHIF